MNIYQFLKDYKTDIDSGKLPEGKEKEIIELLKDYKESYIANFINNTVEPLINYLIRFKYNLGDAQKYYYIDQIRYLKTHIMTEYRIFKEIDEDTYNTILYSVIDDLQFMEYDVTINIIPEFCKEYDLLGIEFDNSGYSRKLSEMTNEFLKTYATSKEAKDELL